MRRHALQGSAALAALLAAMGCGSAPGATAAAAASPPVVVALGRLEPKDRVIDISVPGDQRLDRVMVTQGQMVKAGDVLAYLQSYERGKAARDRAAALLQDAVDRLAADTQQAQARIEEAARHVGQLKEVPALEIQAQRARIRATQADLALAVTDLTRLRSLAANGAMSQQDVERQAALVDRLKATLDSDEAQLQRLIKTAETDRAIAEAQLTTRSRELDSVRAAAQLASARTAVALADAELKDSIIHAPSDGQILEIIANPGEAVLGRVVLRMGDVTAMYVMAEVYETDIARVRLGQRVELSSPALSKVLTGTIERVGTIVYRRQVRSIDPQAEADARVIQVRARLDDPQEASRFVGLQVEVRTVGK